MNLPTHIDLLRTVHRSCRYLNPDTKGGAHADVLAVDAEALAANLCTLVDCPPDSATGEALAEGARRVARRFILKRGKIEDFSMQLVGPRENTLPRDRIAHAFGPFGYNVLPTVDKVLIDAHEAAREVPYFGCGPREDLLAPDLLSQFQEIARQGTLPEDFGIPAPEDRFLTFLDELAGGHQALSLYDVLDSDPYFKGSVKDLDGLHAFQDFVRTNPLTRVMEDQFESFFAAPITVGVRDTLRWMRGSRHPDLGWEKARATIFQAFERQRTVNFIPAEITWYAPDLTSDAAALQALAQNNRRTVERFAAVLDAHFKSEGFPGLSRDVLVALATQVLDFHHGFPVYELEPYQGLLSASTLKLALRVVADGSLALAGVALPGRTNDRLNHLLGRPGPFVELARKMDGDEQQHYLRALERSLAFYVSRKGVLDGEGHAWQYQSVPRTFYSFQEQADYPARVKGRVQEMFSLEELNQPERAHLLAELPELAEKLTVFFTLVYRYYKDTGFVPDLRPRNAGRDIFILGIWGQVSDNLLITLWRDGGGELHADLAFVDNKDQFKEYRRTEDRRAPVGMAKHALRLTGSIIEPAMLRTIGSFTEQTWANDSGGTQPRPSVLSKYATRGLDIAHEVVHTGIEQFFDNAKVAVEDAADDIFAGLRKYFGR